MSPVLIADKIDPLDRAVIFNLAVTVIDVTGKVELRIMGAIAGYVDGARLRGADRLYGGLCGPLHRALTKQGERVVDRLAVRVQ